MSHEHSFTREIERWTSGGKTFVRRACSCGAQQVDEE